MPAENDLTGFIRSSFRSIWSLELLLLLKRNMRPWTHEEIVRTLRASDLIVSQSLQTLACGGLIVIGENDDVIYRPASRRLSLMADEVEDLYARSPDAIRRLIVTSSSGLAAFADAFRLRKGDLP
jgi:hypothetical protein